MRPLFLLLTLSCHCFAAADNSRWSPRYFPPGPDEEVSALRSFGNVLYVGGNFRSFGPWPYEGIVQWDGRAWSPMGSGLKGKVYGIAVDAGGRVYAAGDLSDGRDGYGLAQWEGSGWKFPAGAKGRKCYGPVAALGTEAYVVFSGENEIYRLTGPTLESLNAAPNGEITALEGIGGQLYAGGGFSRIGGVVSNHAAVFSAGRWNGLAGGTEVEVTSFAQAGSGLLAGGKAGGGPALAMWDGSKWTSFDRVPGNRGTVTHVAWHEGMAYASGEFDAVRHGFAKWTGSDWIQMGSEVLNYDIQAVAVLGGQPWVGGRFSHPSARFLVKWQDGAWVDGLGFKSLLPSARIRHFLRIGGRLLASGQFSTASPDSLSLLAEWTGAGWANRAPAFPRAGFQLLNIEVLAQDAAGVVAAGNFSIRDGVSAYGVRAWRGGEWIRFGDDADGPMRALCVTPEGIFAGGSFKTIGGVEAHHVARWDGNAWQPLGPGLPGYVTALGWDGSALVAADVLYTVENGKVKSDAHVWSWNGSTWKALGEGDAGRFSPTTITGFLNRGSEMWAVGEFDSVGNTKARGVAAWDGIAWTQVGEGLERPAVLAVGPDGKVYAGGNFSEPSPGVAVWNGTAWEGMGDGLTFGDGSPGVAQALSADPEGVFVAGAFTFAGGKSSSNLARWTVIPEELSVRPRRLAQRATTPWYLLSPDGNRLFRLPQGPRYVDILGRSIHPDKLRMGARPGR